MKRALIISYYWPPSGGSGVQRWVKFAKYLPSEGWQPVIYTPENPELTAIDESLCKEIPPEAEIIRTHITEPYDLYRRLTGAGKGNTGGRNEVRQKEVNPINGGKKSLKEKISLWIRGNFFIPDPRCLWTGPSVRFLKKYLKEHPVDIIISTGPPHSMHIIAMKTAEALGLPWIADFRDPWTKMFYFKHLHLSAFARKRHERLERKVLDKADAVVAVSPFVQQEFQEMTHTPVSLITNGFDENDFAIEVKTDGYFNITHTGLFAADGNPDVLWSVLGEICREDKVFKGKLRIRLAGKTDREIIESAYAAGLADNIVDSGYVDHIKAVEEQKAATLLILPLRKEPEYRATLPGKLFEYLASGRPILGIGQQDGAMAMIIRETGTGVVFDWNDAVSIRKYIGLCWKNYLSGTSFPRDTDISRYSRKKLTTTMAELMDATVAVHKANKK